MRKGLIVVGVLVLAGQVAGCRERSGSLASLKADGSVDEAMQIVSVLDQTCGEAGCHASENNQLPRSELMMLADQTKKVSDCLSDPEKANDATKQVTCFRSGGAAFSRSLGVYRAMVKDESLAGIVKASGATEVQQKQFAKLIMPPGHDGNAFESADSWRRIRDWLAAQPPTYAGINAARPQAEAEGKECQERISPELMAHVQKLQAPNAPTWTKIHRDNKLPMFGCPEKNDFPKDPLACLTNFKDRTEWAAPNPVPGVQAFKIRELREMPGFTSFWTRSSPDGRFVGNGGAPDDSRNDRASNARRANRRGGDRNDNFDDFNFNAAIDDLAVKDRRILVTASFDPAFSPDNTKFMYVGTICPMQPLRNTKTKSINTDDEQKTGCFTDNQIATYQSIGQEAGAGDRFTVINPGNYEVDNSGTSPDGAADPLYVPTNTMAIHTFQTDASGAFKNTVVPARTPAESQPSVSVTAALLVQRFSPKQVGDDDDIFFSGGDFENFSGGGDGGSDSGDGNDSSGKAKGNKPLLPSGGVDTTGDVSPGLKLAGDDDFASVIKKTGYRIRFVDKMRTEKLQYDAANDPTASEICMKGNKAMFSYDDRFVVTHHAIDQEDDPANAGKHSDIWLYDILTKRKVQVTKTPPGVFALYPHFRADGWIYFLIREWDAAGQVRQDRIMATDAALQLMKH